MNKRIILTLIVAVIAVFTTSSVYAQEKGEMAIGGGLSVATGDDITNFGIGAKFQWNPINNLRLEPSFNYFFKKESVSMWDLSANVHYLLPVSETVTVYPLAGLGIQNAKAHLGDYGLEGIGLNDSKTDFAFNIGAGVDIQLAENWIGNFEFKYKVSDFNRAVFSLGVAYKF